MFDSPAIHGRERGMTFLGLLMLLAFVGVFLYGGVRLVPVYVEYMNVAKALEALKGDAAGGGSVPAFQRTLERQFDIEDVHSVTPKDIEFSREGNSVVARAVYDAYAPFIANVSFVVHFDKTVTLAASSGP